MVKSHCQSKAFIGGIAKNHDVSGLLSLEVPGVPWHLQILADLLTLSQPRGVDCAYQMILAPPDFQAFRRPCVYKISHFSTWISQILEIQPYLRKSIDDLCPIFKIFKVLIWFPVLSNMKINYPNLLSLNGCLQIFKRVKDKCSVCDFGD